MKKATHRQWLYLPVDLLEELEAEAARCGCSVSAMMQQAWTLAHPTLNTMPGLDDYWPVRANADQTHPVADLQAEG